MTQEAASFAIWHGSLLPYSRPRPGWSSYLGHLPGRGFRSAVHPQPEEATQNRAEAGRFGQPHLRSPVVNQLDPTKAFAAGVDRHQAQLVPQNSARLAVDPGTPARIMGHLHRNELVRPQLGRDLSFMRALPAELRGGQFGVLQSVHKCCDRFDVQRVLRLFLNPVRGLNHVSQRG